MDWNRYPAIHARTLYFSNFARQQVKIVEPPGNQLRVMKTTPSGCLQIFYIRSCAVYRV